jgi:protein-L-isoaspartate(D-aspartate) O-methyltransferase
MDLRPIVAILLLSCSAAQRSSAPEPTLATPVPAAVAAERSHERDAMVLVQIEHPPDGRRAVRDPAVLAAMRAVQRHRFVPEEAWDLAYTDSPLLIAAGQTISQPYIVALMTELLQPQSGDVILEVGTGSGYQAAVLAEIVEHVHTVEIVRLLADRARDDLTAAGYRNVTVYAGDGYLGKPEHAPFDGIVVTAAPDHIPQPLVDQLKIGGRLVLPVGPQGLEGQDLVVLVKKQDGTVERTSVLPVRFVPLTGPNARRAPP